MTKYYKHAALALATAYLIGCSGNGSCNNDSGGNDGDASSLQIIAPKIIYSKTASISSSYVTVINPTTIAIKNLHYTLNNPVGSGSLASIDETTANNCAVIPANSQCNFKLNVAAGAVAGSLRISANNDSSLIARLFKSNQSTTNVTLPVGIEQAYYNSIAGADGIAVSYYHTVIAGVPYILVSGVVASDKAGSFNNIVLVDGNGNILPNQQLISGNASSAQGSTFSILLPVSSASGSSQTIKVQTRQIATDGSATVVSTATAGNTLATTNGVGIADMLPSAVYLTSTNPEQIITFVNNGDATAQLQSLIASNPNIEVVFSPTSLNSGGMTTATLKLKNSASSATSGSATLSYNNGKEEVKTAAIVEQNISPQPNPNPSPSPSPTGAPTPPVPTAGLTAVLTPDSNFYTTTAIGTVSRQLALTNTGSTTENGFVLTLPTNFTISAGTSNSCTVTHGTSPATISDNLAANGGSCNINITYANTTATAQNTGTISVAYNYNGGAAATPATTGVNYQVTQSTANLILTPNPVTFANVLNNNVDYNQQTVTVTNSGDETATNLGFSISGTNSGLFSVIAGGTCASGGVLPNITGSNTCTITTQFGTFTSTVDPGNKTANLDVNYFPYSGAGATITTASSVLNGQATAAQSASIAQGAATGSGFAGGDGNSNTPYQIEKNATTPSISYTITNSGAVAANSFYLSGSASGYTIGGNCGTSGSPVTLAADTGSCTTTFTLNSTASTGSQNLDVSGITMHWVDQDTPSGQTQNMNGTQYVNVYAPATIAITTSPASSISIAPGDSFTITATLTDGYNESAQTIQATTANSDITFSTGGACQVSSASNTCGIITTASGTAATASGQTVTLSNTTTPAMSPTPATVSFAIAPAFPRVYLPQTGQMYCVPGTSFTTTCGSGYTSVAGTDGYGRNIPSYGDYIPYGVAWAYNGTGALNPLTRFSAGTQADGTTACPSGQEVRNDKLTGLMWVQNPNPTSYAWQDMMNPNIYPAQATIDAMNASGYCGYTDWRLPNVNELASLVNQGAASTATWLKDPAQGFGTNVQSDYWSSTTSALTTASAWIVNVDIGGVGSSDKAWGNNPVWPVRGTTALPAQIPQTGQITSYAPDDDGALQKGTTGTTASGRFVVGSGTEADCITDQQTGLIWVKDLNTVNSGNAASSWSNAISIANGTWCGHTDWRLPNRNELRSLVNYGQSDIASWLNNPAQGFSNVRAGSYWSSTTSANGTGAAWYIDMTDGLVDPATKSTGFKYVWPVRGGQ